MAIKKLNRSCIVIASSDFTHYEPQETARKVDAKLLEAILEYGCSRALRQSVSATMPQHAAMGR